MFRFFIPAFLFVLMLCFPVLALILVPAAVIYGLGKLERARHLKHCLDAYRDDQAEQVRQKVLRRL